MCTTGGFGGMGGECDVDHDGYNKEGFPCCGYDCDDNSGDVHPNQDKYFDVPRPGSMPGSPTEFDYDCSNSNNPNPGQLFNMTGDAVCSGALCIPNEGYDINLAHCGDDEGYVACNLVLCKAETTQADEALKCK